MDERETLVRAITTAHRDEPGALMPVLHAVLDELGHVTADDQAAIADVLNLSRADVHGVVTFYDDFRTTPPPAHEVRLCRAEACQSVGAEELVPAVEEIAARPGVEEREVFCLGNCALGPSALLDGRLHGRLTPARLADLTREWGR